MKKSAMYHSPEGGRVLAVAAEHADGTVDLADADGNVEIAKCEVVDGLVVGSCTIISQAEAKAEAKSDKK